MPQTYAHQYYGDLVYGQLPQEIQTVIDGHRDLYDIGLQGPDILFYYHPLWHNPVAQLGNDMHEWSGRRFFARAAGALADVDPQDDDAFAGLAYLYGCLCHFALDSICHAYINRYDAMTEGVTHSVIEGDFDRMLIARQGRDPVLENMVERFVPSRDAARVIASFYPEVPEETLYKALRSFVGFHGLIRCPSDGKRNFLYTALRVIGQYDSLRGHITAPAADPLCKESSARLEELLHDGVACGTSLIAGFTQNLQYDNQYRLNFEGVEVTD